LENATLFQEDFTRTKAIFLGICRLSAANLVAVKFYIHGLLGYEEMHHLEKGIRPHGPQRLDISMNRL